MTFNRTAGALLACSLAIPVSAARALPHPDHHEFEATVRAQYQAAPGAPRDALLEFSFPDADTLLVAAWRVEVVDSRGARLRTLYGETALQRGSGRQTVSWDGKNAQGAPAAAGFYELRLTARAVPLSDVLARSGTPAPSRVERFLAAGDDQVEERADLRVGRLPAPTLLPFRALPSGGGTSRAGRNTASVAATGSFPYSISYGNLHSQTNHTDGGADVSSCGTSENPWAGAFGPSDAWEMMRTQAGGDILLTSEHNHMYDGSTSTNGAADPAKSHSLFNGGLQAASDYTAAHPGFLALYGTEFGVISNGGHMNVLNPDGLATWESTSGGALFGDYFVPKSDYAAMYALMKSRGWVGQFNHPQLSQFAINGVSLAWDANGDEVMALCEVNNTNAFSHNVTETETARPNYELTYQALLERGYHVAPSSDQDNHCANWGLSYTNRTGVLIPAGTPLTKDSFIAAVRARHVFATLDRRSQIVLATSAGAIMGDRTSNAGPLTLNVYWATTGAHTVSRTQIFEGVPGRNGTVTQLSDGLSTVTLTPSTGQHFYYAVITEENGDKLWSAPIWVSESAGAVNATIVTPAADLTVANGAAVSFTGSATTQHTSIVSYAWDFGDGGTAAGASATHTYTNPGASALTFLATFTATDDQGAIGAATRSITVQPDASQNTPPTITAIGDISLVKNSGGTVSFTVGDAQTSAALLDVSAASSNASLFPAASLVAGGSGASRTLAVNPAPGRTGTASITVTVVDSAGATASSSFTATVVDGAPTLIISQYYEGTNNNKWLEVTNVGTATYPGSGLFIGSWFNPATGGTTYSVNPITQTIPAGATVLFKNSLSTTPVSGNITGTPTSIVGGAMQFNGDDITYITPSSANTSASYAARVDSIGINQASWTASGGSTATGGQDRSYVRNAGVVSQSADYVASQWTKLTLAQVDGSLAGTTERLGEHVFNHAPAIGDLSDVTVYSGDPVGPLSFTVSDTETDAGSLTVSASSSNEQLLPASAVVFGGSGGTRTFSATPVADQVGSAAITLTVTDAGGRSASTGFLVTVNAPVVTGVTIDPVSVLLHNGAQQQFTAQVSGLGAFSTEVRWSASGGTIDGNGFYTPPLSGGPYTVTAASAQDPSFAASAQVIVNRAPVTADSSVNTNEDMAVTVTLEAADADGDVLAFAVVVPPAHGQLSGSGAALTYTPDPDFNGADGFTFAATDGFSDPVAGQVSIAVRAVNDAPVAADQHLTTLEDTPLAVDLTATDLESDPLFFRVVAPPLHGHLLGAPPNLTYVPDPDWNGTDAFGFIANDGELDSAVATVLIDVQPVDDAPVATAQTVITHVGSPVRIILSATDREGDPLTYRVVATPAHGRLFSGSPLVYVPQAGFIGTDSFRFVANDGALDSAPATITIEIKRGPPVGLDPPPGMD